MHEQILGPDLDLQGYRTCKTKVTESTETLCLLLTKIKSCPEICHNVATVAILPLVTESLLKVILLSLHYYL